MDQNLENMPLFRGALQQLDKALGYVQLDSDTIEVIKRPMSVHIVSIRVRRDDGSLSTLTGYRVQYNNSCGPTKGGIRFHPAVNLDEVQSLAFWMTIKCAVMELPYGGGKGGVCFNPKEFTPAEIERVSRGYINELADVIGPDQDIPAPDVYTNSRIMGWMADQYAVVTRKFQPAVITGKPLSLGGSLGRNDATGRGGFYCLEALKEKLGLSTGATIAIQGFGNAGQHFARLASEAGYKVVAVSDSRGGVYVESGMDPVQVAQTKNEKRRLTALDAKGQEVEHRVLTNEELLELDVDVLVPAALENQITSANVSEIKARVILELANGPTSFDADETLFQNGQIVIPDILANAGGVTVSYYEWVQNRIGEYWEEEKVRRKLEPKMKNAALKVYSTSQEHNCSLRTAAYTLACARVGEAIEAHGNRKFFKTE